MQRKEKVYLPIFSNGGNFASSIRHSRCEFAFLHWKEEKKIHSFRSCDLISIVLNIIQTCLGKDTDLKGKIEEETPVHETPPKLW